MEHVVATFNAVEYVFFGDVYVFYIAFVVMSVL
jgi:hypothetical protein